MDHKWTIILTNFHYVIKGCHQGVRPLDDRVCPHDDQSKKR